MATKVIPRARAGSKDDDKQLDFLYKFEPGIAQASFGILVAEKAGLNAKVLEIASRKAAQFNDRLSSLVNRIKDHKNKA